MFWDKGYNLCGATRIDAPDQRRPLTFPRPNNAGSPDNGRSPRLATEPRKAVRRCPRKSIPSGGPCRDPTTRSSLKGPSPEVLLFFIGLAF